MTDRDGKWMLSANEEDYSWAEEFATKEDAVASIPEFCEENDTDICWIGLAREVKLADLFSLNCVRGIVENMEEHEDLLWRDEHTFAIGGTKASELRALILDWMRKNLGEPGVFTIDGACCYNRYGGEYE